MPSRNQENRPPWEPPKEFDDYEVVEFLGAGAMGRVYAARDRRLDCTIALKFVIGPANLRWRRYLREVRALARLLHPNIVSLRRAGEIGGHPYLAMELISGKTLAALPKPLPWRRALAIGVGLARGLASAHRTGVVHCDIKPSNVMVTDDGSVKLLDFGLAYSMESTTSLGGSLPSETRTGINGSTNWAASTVTATTTDFGFEPQLSLTCESCDLEHRVRPVGTPLYMAPEVWRGEPATQRSDLYSFGMVMHELCVGRPPNSGLPREALPTAALEGDVPSIAPLVPEMDPAFARAIDRCTRRESSRRLVCADTLRRALEEMVLRGQPNGAGVGRLAGGTVDEWWTGM